MAACFIDKTWEKIKTQKELNLPDQRAMVANYRCTELKDEALELIEKSFTSILLRLKVPYFDIYTNKLTDKNFFTALNKVAQDKAPVSKVYVTGPVIRNLLSYIYKKLYNEH